jgi:hypothetical protein
LARALQNREPGGVSSAVAGGSVATGQHGETVLLFVAAQHGEAAHHIAAAPGGVPSLNADQDLISPWMAIHIATGWSCWRCLLEEGQLAASSTVWQILSAL